MASTFDTVDATLVPQVLRFVFLYCMLDVFLHGPSSWDIAIGRPFFQSVVWGLVATSVVITIVARAWLKQVTIYAPEPYLDEVFHIPQVQRLCQGDFTWDDKITTPPGLYILSILFNRVSGLTCSVLHLRLFNVEITAYAAAAAVLCRSWIEQPRLQDPIPRRFSGYALFTGLHIALFPVLFFFSGLYYTDVISTFAVLVAYVNQLRRLGSVKTPGFFNSYLTFSWSLLALCMRQTNIFWVVVFMGGLEVVHGIKSLEPVPQATPPFSTLSEQIKFYAWRYSKGDIHDPPLNAVYPVDLILCIISVCIAAVCNMRAILPRIVPHLLVLAAFVSFVVANKGVVLGDKSNHVATLHLAQLLYIWPLFAFFSAPLFIPQVLNVAESVYQVLMTSLASKSTSRQQGRDEGATGKLPRQSDALKMFNWLGTNTKLQVISTAIGALVAAIAIIRFNTIIHPFTLADNRHYMFYVFRYSILKAWWVRYALAPIYVLCGWLCWTALRGYEDSTYTLRGGEWIRSPFTTTPTYSWSPAWPSSSQPSSSSGGSSSTSDQNGNGGGAAPTTTSNTMETQQQWERKQPQLPYIPRTPTATSPPMPIPITNRIPHTSTALLLLLATSLSLMTAPLVEPRYFILPWVFWRLSLPSLPSPAPPGTVFRAPPETTRHQTIADKRAREEQHQDRLQYLRYFLHRARQPRHPRRWWQQQWRRVGDPRLVLELLWFAAINAGTMYVFLTKPFFWKSPSEMVVAEDGSSAPALLDGGRVQRFMW
ncbi:glucosyltransferase [Diatrype stigma]|uniref:Dol-P-Glc:Glc(2)Man(9)GlcNAc(2)-PP-Dol alpha-1,2-glucosyltransferase n=1 Tax=Diatrype stigma TaxID=117547 RepID=A0AAN9UX35_9PEZI